MNKIRIRFLWLISTLSAITAFPIGERQEIDPFLSTAHEHVQRLCHGGLGCGPIKTSWNNTFEARPKLSSADLDHFYGQVEKTNVTEMKEMNLTILSVDGKAHEWSGEEELENGSSYENTEEISFLSNFSIKHLDTAISLMCKDSNGCNETFIHYNLPKAEGVNVAAIFACIGVALLAVSFFFGGLVLYTKLRARVIVSPVVPPTPPNSLEDFDAIELSSVDDGENEHRCSPSEGDEEGRSSMHDYEMPVTEL